jgi:hypothetical protein
MDYLQLKPNHGLKQPPIGLLQGKAQFHQFLKELPLELEAHLLIQLHTPQMHRRSFLHPI